MSTEKDQKDIIEHGMEIYIPDGDKVGKKLLQEYFIGIAHIYVDYYAFKALDNGWVEFNE